MFEHAVLCQKLPEDQRYMSAFLGQLGPENVLEPWFQTIIKEKVESNELKFNGDGEDFLNHLTVLQDELGLYSEFQRPVVHGKTHEEHEYILSSIKRRIRKEEEAMINMFSGGRDELKKSLEMIESMDFHQRFLEELKSESFLISPTNLFILNHITPLLLKKST